MPFALRIRLDPVLTRSKEGGPASVTAVRPSFTVRGDGLTKAPKDSPVPAKLEFVGRFFSTVRDHPGPVEVALGELSGQLTMTAGPATARFACDADSLKALTKEPDPDESEDDDSDWTFAPQVLDLVLESPFSGLDGTGDAPRLLLPADTADFKYLEVVVKLSIQGALEADFDDNDVLDVPISLARRPLYPFSV